MDRQAVTKMAKYYALIAVDGGFVDDQRDNLIDTLNDEGHSEWVNDALDAYEESVKANYALRDRANIY